jgi:DNA-binding NtrC family response regulator
MPKPVMICIDQDRSLLEQLRTELRVAIGRDCGIVIANSGQRALALIDDLLEEDNEIPLVLTDYHLPDLPGDELLRQIHHRLPSSYTILLSGSATLEALAQVMQVTNLFRYLAKPWQAENLQQAVSQALRRYLQEKRLTEEYLKLLQLNQDLERLNQSLEQRLADCTQELAAVRARFQDPGPLA